MGTECRNEAVVLWLEEGDVVVRTQRWALGRAWGGVLQGAVGCILLWVSPAEA